MYHSWPFINITFISITFINITYGQINANNINISLISLIFFIIRRNREALSHIVCHLNALTKNICQNVDEFF